MTDTTTKTRIIRDLQGDLLDCNHVTRRHFRMFLDGSYNGEKSYYANKAFLMAHHTEPKKLRSWVINQFTQFTATDAYCSYGYAQKVIVDTIDRDTLEKLNVALVEDALDLIEYDLKEAV
tara:strand:- start:44 stop:403 length:360 start_codon:yes stop_codon:yes gene_type:complete